MSADILSHKESLVQAKTFTVPEEITRSLAQIFQDAQATYVGHRKHIIILKTIQERAHKLNFEDAFNIAFCKLVNKLLPIKKAESVADRIVKMVANFVVSIQDEEDENKKDDDEEQEVTETVAGRFTNHFIHHLLRGIEAKDKNVRFRVLHILSLVISGLGELDQELYDTLFWAIRKRLFDKEPTVRVKAVLCFSRFQEEEADVEDEESAVGQLLSIIQNDSSAEVRRAVLLNLEKNETTLPYIMERAKDTNSVNRKLIYSRIVKEIGDFRLLDRKIREKILTWGLKDREPQVQQAAIKMFCVQWFNNCDGDLMELLERLHLLKNDVAEIAIKFFFDQKPEVVSKISFDKDFWTKLNVEASFLAKVFYDYCNKNNMNETIDNNFPEATEFASLLNKYLKVRKQTLEESDESSDDINFVIEQLLLIAKNYDFGDEVGRREMLQVLRSSFYDELTDKQTSIALEALKKISISEKDFCQMAVEIILDIRDADEDDGFAMDMDLDLETEDPERAKKNEKMMSKALQCLSLARHMLELTHEPLRGNIPVTSLLDSVINPAIRSKVTPIRENGIICLGLCCLLDETLAVEQLAFFGICCAKGNEEIQAACLKIIFDILSLYGPKVLDVPGCVDTLSMHKLLFRSLKKFERPSIQAITGEGLCKLYLNDIFNDEELFETLLLAYFHPQNADNEELLQALSFCLPAYAFSHPNHQEMIAKVAADTFSRSFQASEEAQRAAAEQDIAINLPPPGSIIQQLIFWSDPNNLVNCPEEIKKNSKHHYNIAISCLELLCAPEISKIFAKAIAMNLSKLSISKNLPLKDYETLHEKTLFTYDEVQENIIADAPTMNALNRFVSLAEGLLSDISEREKEKEQNVSKDDEFVKALTQQEDNLKEKEEEKEAEVGDASDNIVVPDLSLAKIASNNSMMEKSDDESFKSFEADILPDLDDDKPKDGEKDDEIVSSDEEQVADEQLADKDEDIIVSTCDEKTDDDPLLIIKKSRKKNSIKNTKSLKNTSLKDDITETTSISEEGNDSNVSKSSKSSKTTKKSSKKSSNESFEGHYSDSDSEERIQRKPKKRTTKSSKQITDEKIRSENDDDDGDDDEDDSSIMLVSDKDEFSSIRLDSDGDVSME